MISIHLIVLGDDAGLSSENCVHVDSFLYDEDDEEQLVKEGLLARSYCLDCGSRKIEDLTYITHSCSKERLQFIFGDLLPSLEGKTVVDVGSRLGAVLYGAYYYSDASKIVGIEINKDFCKLQEDAVAKFGLGSRVKIVLGNMCAQTALLASADVVVLNNVFSWFMPEQLQVMMRHCLHRICLYRVEYLLRILYLYFVCIMSVFFLYHVFCRQRCGNVCTE